ESVALDSPVVVAAFDGWVDAGNAGTLAAKQLLGGDSRVVATFDADMLFDYRARRPTLDSVDGTLQSLEWPELHLRASHFGERDLLVLTGPEPDFRWNDLSSEVTGLMKQLGVSTWVSLGSIPAAAAATRPVPVLGPASCPRLLPDGRSQGPVRRPRS